MHADLTGSAGWNSRAHLPAVRRSSERSSKLSISEIRVPKPSADSAFLVCHSVSEWAPAIHALWAEVHAGPFELARVVAAAKKGPLHGQWKEIWESLPFSRRKADMLAANGQTFARLPSGWSLLYQLAQLQPATFGDLFATGAVHPCLSLREAMELVAKHNSRRRVGTRKTQIKDRINRFVAFVRGTQRDWQPDERSFAAKELGRPLEEIDLDAGCSTNHPIQS